MERPRIMGILNVTPDSFSDGGDFMDPDNAVEHGVRMAEEGADIIDIGGESTRPGSRQIPAGLQIDRVLPVIEGLKARVPPDTVICIDTRLAEVAETAIQAGVTMINDISAGRDDAGIFKLAADHKVPLVLMHMQGTPQTMQEHPTYTDVITDIKSFLRQRIQLALAAGVAETNIIVDPGIGFGKAFEHNIDIIRNLHSLVEMGYPVLLGASRKRFLQSICRSRDFSDLSGATCGTTAIGMYAGVSIFRVHDVRENRQVVDVLYEVGWE